MNTALEQLEHWIEQYKRINGTPPINEVLTQIDLLKDYEKEKCNIDLVSQRDLLIEAFDLNNILDGDRDKIAVLVDITLESINGG